MRGPEGARSRSRPGSGPADAPAAIQLVSSLLRLRQGRSHHPGVCELRTASLGWLLIIPPVLYALDDGRPSRASDGLSVCDMGERHLLDLAASSRRGRLRHLDPGEAEQVRTLATGAGTSVCGRHVRGPVGHELDLGRAPTVRDAGSERWSVDLTQTLDASPWDARRLHPTPLQ